MIQLKKHFVKNTETGAKARVFYSHGEIYTKTGETQEVVSLYAKDYGDQLSPVFGLRAENNSHYQSDYVERDHVRILPTDDLFKEALRLSQL